MVQKFRQLPPNLRTLVIEAERVRLVAIAERFTEEIFRNFTPEITRYMMPAPAVEISETSAFVSSALAGLDRGDDLQFAICQSSDDEFLGVCGLHISPRPARPQLGIWIRRAAHGNHYGLEAIGALRDWAEIHLDFECLIYPVDRRNFPSRKIAEALGGVVIEEKKVMSMSGTELDELIYAIGRRD